MEFIDLKSQYRIIKNDLKKNINHTLNHNKFILGPENKILENKLSNFVNSKYCLTVSSGTDALLISLMALNINEGDEVITTSYSYISTIEVIVNLKAIPIMIDINEFDCNLNEDLIEKNINRKTKAIIAVSLFGQPANLDKINKIANKYKIPVIEDSAQSFGSELNNKKSCSLTTIGCTSFFPSKSLSCYGDAGAIFTNSSNLYKKMKTLRSHGQTKTYHHSFVGISGRMDTIQCSILLSKLKIFKKELSKRKKIAEIYDDFFDMKKIKRLKVNNDKKSVYSVYPIFIKNRKDCIKKLNKNKIPFKIYYPMPMNHQKAYKKYSTSIQKVANKISKQILCIPIHPYLSKNDINRIFEIFN